jgi:hypothetical protein
VTRGDPYVVHAPVEGGGAVAGLHLLPQTTVERARARAIAGQVRIGWRRRGSRNPRCTAARLGSPAPRVCRTARIARFRGHASRGCRAGGRARVTVQRRPSLIGSIDARAGEHQQESPGGPASHHGSGGQFDPHHGCTVTRLHSWPRPGLGLRRRERGRKDRSSGLEDHRSRCTRARHIPAAAWPRSTPEAERRLGR